jgi:hypothetical protein
MSRRLLLALVLGILLAGCGGEETVAPTAETVVGTVPGEIDVSGGDPQAGKDRQFILESIVNPDAEVTEGFADNLMPEDYGQKLTEEQLADLVAFLKPQS